MASKKHFPCRIFYGMHESACTCKPLIGAPRRRRPTDSESSVMRSLKNSYRVVCRWQGSHCVTAIALRKAIIEQRSRERRLEAKK